jgi:hypothetical protein
MDKPNSCLSLVTGLKGFGKPRVALAFHFAPTCLRAFLHCL